MTVIVIPDTEHKGKGGPRDSCDTSCVAKVDKPRVAISGGSSYVVSYYEIPVIHRHNVIKKGVFSALVP
jgi:hypothetical protein